MLGKRNRRCEDCGRSFQWEALNRVVWTYRVDEDVTQVTRLQLCFPCSRRMARDFKGDEDCTLAFHPI